MATTFIKGDPASTPTAGQTLVYDAGLKAYVPGSSGGGGTVDWADITGKPANYPPAPHDHDTRYVRTVNDVGPDSAGNVTVSGGGGASTLDDLTDVDTTGATAGQVLTFDGSEWSPDAPSAGTVTSTDITDSTSTGRALITATDAAVARDTIGAASASDLDGFVQGEGVTRIVSLTQAAYDALPVPRPTDVLYVVVG